MEKDYLSLMQELADCSEPEHAHSKADKLLCELLTDLGYGNIVNAYEKVEKWYA